jgi:hypothetical protein
MVNGGFAYGYLFIAQNPGAEKIFTEFLNEVKPARILEIGTMHGGLTLMLRDILDSIGLSSTLIRTYDINDQEFLKPLVVNRSVDVITKNLFNDNYTDFYDDQCHKETVDFIQQDGLTVVLCDGGCKKCEYTILVPLLKKDDIIMAHDYAPNIEYFEKYMKDKIWDWMEINDNDIAEISSKYNLRPFRQELLINIAWNCRKKYDV